MIKPTESVLEIERGLYDSKLCIFSPPFDRRHAKLPHLARTCHTVTMFSSCGTSVRIYTTAYIAYSTQLNNLKAWPANPAPCMDFVCLSTANVSVQVLVRSSGVLIGGRGS